MTRQMNIMRIIIILLISCTAFLSSCFKDHDKDFYLEDFRLEFQDAVLNNNAVNKSFPIVEAKEGVNKFQVNLLGGLFPEKLEVQIKILTEETTAVEGTHFVLPEGKKVSFAPETALADLEVEIPELPEGTDMLLVVELLENNLAKVNKNYNTLGIKIKK